MIIPSSPASRKDLPLEQQIGQLSDYVNNLDRALRSGQRFGWPIDSPLLLAQSTSAPGALAVPANINATGLYQQIALSWDLVTSPALLDFEIARSTTSGGALTILGHTQGNCFLDTGPLADSTAYFYKIQARLLDGSTYSGLSAEATATTLANDTTADAQLAVALRLLADNTHRVNLATGTTGILPVASGGTGQGLGAIAIMEFNGVAVVAGSTVFLGPGADATEANINFVFPAGAGNGTVLGMSSRTSVPPGAGESFTYTLRIAAADTALTHAVTGGAGNLGGSSTGAIAVANQRICVKLVTTAAAAAANHMLTVAIRVIG